MTSATAIRSQFLDYFKSSGHSEVASASLVPDNDPTLLFINSGMVQFKNIFTGKETRDYNRAVTAQKCVRAGGKHNDLENVGYTARHHTFFEMLGNFSFGDYFKEQAIEYAWGMVRHELGLSEDRLLVTVYADDEEAVDLWRKIAGLSDSKIIRIGTSDNFWQMGDTGPCGPCSEIFYDHGEGIFGGPPGSADEDGDRFIEIWNLVFMQYEQFESGERESLPHPSIDTGMGLERIAAVLQGKHNNYDVDLLRSIILEISEFTSFDPDGEHSASHKVIADHLRSSAFLIADGVLPSNEGRGYVLRRIMRRGMRHAHILGAGEPLLHRLVGRLVDLMGGHFTELVRAQTLITETLRLEEVRFKSLLDRGLGLLEKEVLRLGDRGVLTGETAFTLYDTYGFPLDLTQDILRGRGIGVDISGFESCMASQREKARSAWSSSQGIGGGSEVSKLWFDLKSEFGATEFLGYGSDRAEAVIVGLVRDGERVDSLSVGERAEILVSQTPFYAESGGQKGDIGFLTRSDSEVSFCVEDTQKRGDILHSHIGVLRSGSLSVGDEVILSIDVSYRDSLRSNHSATHLLHNALRRVLGGHVSQKGSLVGSDSFRFDFSHGSPLSDIELGLVESAVNSQISANILVTTSYMSPDDAISSGALALFGEKYGDEVRVISMGVDSGGVDSGNFYSVELCGGTHVERTGDIGYFRILSEGASASGVRRLEACTGLSAVVRARFVDNCLRDASGLLKSSVDDLSERLRLLLDERKRLGREVEDLRRRLAVSGGGVSGGDSGSIAVKLLGDVSFIGEVLVGVSAKQLRSIAEEKQKQLGSGIVAVFTGLDDKASVVVSVSKDLTSRFDAVTLVRLAAESMGGSGGGGRVDMAQAGGSDVSSISVALEKLESFIVS